MHLLRIVILITMGNMRIICNVLLLVICFQGNIRVFGRVRPLVGDETIGNGGEISHIHFPDDDQCTLELEKLADVNANEVIVVGCCMFFSRPY